MDGLSAIASVIAVVQISSKIFDLCWTYYLGAKDARENIRRLRDEMTSLQDVLTNVAELAEAQGSAKLSILSLLSQSDGPLQRCERELVGLVAKLEPNRGENGMKRLGLRALKWPFNSKEIDETIARIERLKSTFNLALASDQVNLALAIDQGVAELKQQSSAIQTDVAATRAIASATRVDITAYRAGVSRKKLIKWLSTTDPSSNHHAACKRREPTTGEWLTERADFEEWKLTHNSLLWLYGIPGGGKTVLSSTIIEHLKTFCNSNSRCALEYFYFDFNDAEKQKPTNCISSLIAQLCNQVTDLPGRIEDIHREYNNGGQKPAMHDLKMVLMLFAETKQLDDVFIVIDALDECPKNGDEPRRELLELVLEIAGWPALNVHLLAASRPEPDIEEALRPLLKIEPISIQGSQVASDIKLHITSQLARDSRLRKWPDEIKEEIESALTTGANGISVRKALKALPKTLDDTYARILMDIDEDCRGEARRALLWLAFSNRPLTLAEVADAAIAEPDTSFDPRDRFPDPRYVLEILGSLVVVTESSSDDPDDDWDSDPDRQVGSFLVKEYLISERIQRGKASEFATTYVLANHDIAKTCLQYVLYACGLDAIKTTHEDSSSLPLLHYASQYWMSHMLLTPIDGQKPIDPLIRKLFLSPAAFTNWWWICTQRIRLRLPPTPLQYASSLGLDMVVRLLLGYRADDGGEDQGAGMPAHPESAEEHMATAELLLEGWGEVNPKDYDRGAALRHASPGGHEVVVRLLLKTGADVNAKDKIGQTALQLASSEGHETVTRLLLEGGADVNAKSRYGDIPLRLATMGGYKAVVKLLLEKGADVNAKGDDGGMALHQASSRGYEVVVKLLLEAGANADGKDGNGETALHGASRLGHNAVVRLLLDVGTNVNSGDNDGKTALHHASSQGREATARLLLDGGAEVDAKDNSGRTVLYQASSRGRQVVARLLLAWGADINAKSSSGETALHAAASHGGEAIAGLLLEMGIDAGAENSKGETAYRVAVRTSYDAVASLLATHETSLPAGDV